MKVMPQHWSRFDFASGLKICRIRRIVFKTGTMIAFQIELIIIAFLAIPTASYAFIHAVNYNPLNQPEPSFFQYCGYLFCKLLTIQCGQSTELILNWARNTQGYLRKMAIIHTKSRTVVIVQLFFIVPWSSGEQKTRLFIISDVYMFTFLRFQMRPSDLFEASCVPSFSLFLIRGSFLHPYPSLFLYGFLSSLVFFCLSKLPFSGFVQLKGNFVRDQNNSKYHDKALC